MIAVASRHAQSGWPSGRRAASCRCVQNDNSGRRDVRMDAREPCAPPPGCLA